MADALENFREYLRSTVALSPNSVDAYVYDVRKFQTFLETRNLDPARARAADIEAFINRQTANRESPRSTARFLTALRRFYECLLKDGVIQKDPCRNISMPATKRGPPRILSMEHIQDCLNSFREDDPMQFRNKLICEFLYEYALRISDLCAIKTNDISPNLSRLTISGEDERRHFLNDEQRIALREYLARARPRIAPAGEYLFPSRTGGQLHRKSVWRMLRKHLERENLSEELTPRVLRHSRAVHLLVEGVEPRDVRALLGNVDVGTMRRYIRLARSGAGEV